MPYTLELNDSVIYAVEKHSSDEQYKRLLHTLDALEPELEQSPRVVTISLHHHLNGVPHRIKFVEKMMDTLLKRSDTVRHGRFYNLTESMFNAWRHGYDVSLQLVLRHPRTTMAAFAVVVAVTGWMFAAMPKGFLPSEDTGQIFAITEAAQDISFDAMATKQREAARIALAHPAVESVMAAIGSGGATQTLNQGRLFIRLKPGSQRPSVEEVINTLRPRLTQIPGMRVFLQNIPSIRIGQEHVPIHTARCRH